MTDDAQGPLLPAPSDPPWLSWARRELGIHEIAGPEAAARIVFYHSHTSLKATSDEIAWCSSFVCAALEESGLRSTHSAAAKSWVDWGQPTGMKPGAIVVLFNTHAAPSITRSGFHVGLFLAAGKTGPIIIGGNQGDAVSIHEFGPQWRVEAVRAPLDATPRAA